MRRIASTDRIAFSRNRCRTTDRTVTPSLVRRRHRLPVVAVLGATLTVEARNAVALVKHAIKVSLFDCRP